jgi:hypothetical protein
VVGVGQVFVGAVLDVLGFGMSSASFGAAGRWARAILKVRAAVYIRIAFCI